MSLECGRKPECPEETHANTERTYKLFADVVLGYLQQEKLLSTCQSFVAESPNLKEYAEHHTEDGTIPGCLLSLFGKNLTTILNEYITMKAKGLQNRHTAIQGIHV
ncbi:unnamed protein product [Ranitomeya imitator]|uniref:LisH domain-containing protein n=1 Tax=Ranitomeya imitator TaxID=111125 RepID=A0ABN9M1X8_9NEOB|nr:unnamed protein product [Ranitomeya imitator]